MVFVYTTVKTEQEGVILGNNALAEHLVSCVDMWPVRSLYFWEGQPEDISQCMVLFTTDPERIDALTEFIKKNHSYKVPLIGVSPVKITNVDYHLWAKNSIYGE